MYFGEWCCVCVCNAQVRQGKGVNVKKERSDLTSKLENVTYVFALTGMDTREYMGLSFHFFTFSNMSKEEREDKM